MKIQMAEEWNKQNVNKDVHQSAEITVLMYSDCFQYTQEESAKQIEGPIRIPIRSNDIHRERTLSAVHSYNHTIIVDRQLKIMA
jgi:hypothetical protein